MSIGRVVSIFAGLVVTGLLMVSCAPAAKPAETRPTQPQQPPAGAPQQPPASQPSSQGAQPGGQKAPAPAAQISRNGIPLEAGARSGGVLLASYTSEGPTFSTWEESAGNAFQIVQPVSNMIVQRQSWGTPQEYEQGAHWSMQPDLAQSWEQSQDGLTWTFKFFSGVKWSDGTPFTCTDAKWSLDAIRTGKDLMRSPRAAHLLAVESINCPDDLTMVIRLKQPKPSLLEVLGAPHNVVRPKHVYEQDTNAMRTKPPQVGTGPFAVQEWIAGEKAILKRRPDYWNQPFPYLDSIEYRLLTAQAELTGLRAGRLHITASFGNFSGARGEQLLRECDQCQSWPRLTHLAPLFSILPNFQRPPWNTKEVREALSLAIDKKRVIEIGYEGWGLPATGGLYLTGSEWAMPYERVKQIPGYNFEEQVQNKERAKEVLAKAGFKPGELKVDIHFANFYAPSSITIVEDLKAVGIDATGVSDEVARAYNIYSSGDFDLAGHAGWIPGNDPDFILYEFFYTGSDRNYGRFSNPEVDRLIDLQSRTIDPQERKRIAWDVGEILLWEAVRINAGWEVKMPIYSKKVRGLMPGAPSQTAYGAWHRHEHTWLEGG